MTEDLRKFYRQRLEESTQQLASEQGVSFEGTPMFGAFREALAGVQPETVPEFPVYRPGVAGALAAAAQGPQAVARQQAFVQRTAEQNQRSREINRQARGAARKEKTSLQLALAQAEQAFEERRRGRVEKLEGRIEQAQTNLDALAERQRAQERQGEIDAGTLQNMEQQRLINEQRLEKGRLELEEMVRESETGENRAILQDMQTKLDPIWEGLLGTLPDQFGAPGVEVREPRVDEATGQPLLDANGNPQYVRHFGLSDDDEAVQRNWLKYEDLARSRLAASNLTDPELVEDIIALHRKQYFGTALGRFQDIADELEKRINAPKTVPTKYPRGVRADTVEGVNYEEQFTRSLNIHGARLRASLAEFAGVGVEETVTMPGATDFSEAFERAITTGRAIGPDDFQTEQGLQYLGHFYNAGPEARLVPGTPRNKGIEIFREIEARTGKKMLTTLTLKTAGETFEETRVVRPTDDNPWIIRNNQWWFAGQRMENVGPWKPPTKAQAFTRGFVEKQVQELRLATNVASILDTIDALQASIDVSGYGVELPGTFEPKSQLDRELENPGTTQ